MGRARPGASDLPGTEAVLSFDEPMSRELEVLHHRSFEFSPTPVSPVPAEVTYRRG